MDWFFTTQLNSIQFNSILIGTTTIAAATTVTKSSWGWVVESEALREALNVVSLERNHFAWQPH
jgi:hypothetical protein